ncbi:hypothetical protein Tco_0911104 [Tanacetum coccineum]|uniref:Uncharacterized protein n=1 Tax=Tanacetum coccineum TaxID=301880 RepID=A0ABQ5CVP5_9ASTR
MTLNEYLEYETEKERRLRRNVRSKRNPTKYEGADFNSSHRDKSRAFDYPYYHEDIEIKKYYHLPPLLPCFQPTQPYTKASLASFNKNDEVDINSMTIAEYTLCIAKQAFGKHWKEKHVIWARFRKKRDKNSTLQDFDRALDLQCVETASQFPLTPSKLEGDDITVFYDDFMVADLKKPIYDSAG